MWFSIEMLVQQISHWKCASELKMEKIMTELELRESNEGQKIIVLNASVDFIQYKCSLSRKKITRNKGQKKKFQGTYKCEVKSKFIRIYVCMYMWNIMLSRAPGQL